MAATPSPFRSGKPAVTIGNSPSYRLLEDTERLLNDPEAPNPALLLSQPVFTATRLAKPLPPPKMAVASPPPAHDVEPGIRTQRGESLEQSTMTEELEPLTTTFFVGGAVERRRTATFPALTARAELKLRADHNELVQRCNDVLEEEERPPAQLQDEDLEVLKALHSAAVGLAAGQSGVREATKKIMAVCQEHQRDLEILFRHTSEVEGNLNAIQDACRAVEETSRGAILNVERNAVRINDIELEVSDRILDVQETVRKLTRRLIRTTLLANNEACLRLESKGSRRVLSIYWSKWLRRGRARAVCMRLLQKTLRGRQYLCWDTWRNGFLLKRKRHAQSLQHLRVSTNRVITMRYFAKWLAQARRVKKLTRASQILLRSTRGGMLRLFYSKWKGFVACMRQREQLYHTLAQMRYQTQQRLARGRLRTWVQFVNVRKLQRKNARLADVLASSTATSMRQSFLRRWITMHDAKNARRHLSHNLSKSNNRLFAMQYYRRWEELRRRRWFDRRLADGVNHLETRLSLVLAALSKSSETITSLLERQIELESQLLHMSVSKVSIKQLRAEAFKGSLIDLSHAHASPEATVRSIARDALHRPAQNEGDSTRSDSAVNAVRENVAERLAQPSRKQETISTPAQIHIPSQAVKDRRASPPPAAAEDAKWGFQDALLSSHQDPHKGAVIKGGNRPEVPPSSDHDPLRALAVHYGVSTPPVRRRALPE